MKTQTETIAEQPPQETTAPKETLINRLREVVTARHQIVEKLVKYAMVLDENAKGKSKSIRLNKDVMLSLVTTLKLADERIDNLPFIICQMAITDLISEMANNQMLELTQKFEKTD
jgi:hypothetical protein